MPGQQVAKAGRKFRRFSSPAEQEAETIRYWNERSLAEKMQRRLSLSSSPIGREGLTFVLKDQIDLLSAFNDHGVEYLVVGRHAVNAYNQARFTKDPDLPMRGSEANAQSAFKALAEFGAPLAGVSPADDELRKFARER